MNEKKGDLKRLIFYDTCKRHVELKIRLDHDDMTQSEFFRAMVTGYLSNNDLIIEYLNGHRELNLIQSKTKIDSSKKLIKKGKELKQRFSLDEGEKDNIFDLIAEEHPDL
jgi:hypothetical protein